MVYDIFPDPKIDLRPVLMKHLPRSSESVSDFKSLSDHINHRYLEGARAWNLAEAESGFAGIAHHLKSAKRLLSELEWSERQALLNRDGLAVGSITVSRLEKRLDGDIRMVAGLKPKTAPVASKKRNWKAAAVAKACRTAWASAHEDARSGAWTAFVQSRGRDMTAPQRRRSFAPTVQNADRPGPFGRFLEEILEALGVISEDGTAVTAATALRSLKEANARSSP